MKRIWLCVGLISLVTLPAFGQKKEQDRVEKLWNSDERDSECPG